LNAMGRPNTSEIDMWACYSCTKIGERLKATQKTKETAQI